MGEGTVLYGQYRVSDRALPPSVGDLGDQEIGFLSNE